MYMDDEMSTYLIQAYSPFLRRKDVKIPYYIWYYLTETLKSV